VILSQPFDMLKARVIEDIADRASQLANGSASDWPDYQRRVGFIKGLERVQAIIDEMTEEKRK
jgi:hypothetical protein